MNLKFELLKLRERLIPFTIIKSKNKEAKLPLWAKPIISFYTKKHIYVICHKIINKY